MIATTPYLRERELVKQHQMADEIGGALHSLGVDLEVAGLAAHVGVQVFRDAYRHWVAVDNEADLAATTEAVMARLATIVPTKAAATRSKVAAAQRKKVDPTLQRRRPARSRGSAGRRTTQH